MELWQLPQSAVFGGKTYAIHADYRDILEIFTYLQDPDLPESFRWSIALALFYEQPIPEQYLDFQPISIRFRLKIHRKPQHQVP